MGLFDRFKKKSEPTAAQTATVPTPNVVTQQPYVAKAGAIDMSKSAENLNKVLIDMSKTGKIDM